MSLPADRALGALLGTAVGDALGMPLEGLSHQNVRTYYKGVKAYRPDEKRGDLDAGQWTDDTQLTFAVARALTASEIRAADPDALVQVVRQAYIDALPEARRWGPTTTAAVQRLAGQAVDVPPATVPTNGAAMRAAPLGLWWAATEAEVDAAWRFIGPVLSVTHTEPASLAAGFGQAWAVGWAVRHTAADFDQAAFWGEAQAIVRWAEDELGGDDIRVSERLAKLHSNLDDWPLDLQDLCDGTGIAADEAWPFALAMFARHPDLVEASLLSAINVGGDADTVGAMTGALLGALNGWSAFPDEWKDGLEARKRLEAEAHALAAALGSTDGDG